MPGASFCLHFFFVLLSFYRNKNAFHYTTRTRWAKKIELERFWRISTCASARKSNLGAKGPFDYADVIRGRTNKFRTINILKFVG